MTASPTEPALAPSASLSVCVTTRGPADRVRALLELMRPHADEIVLAVNRDEGGETLDACADLADRRLTYELEESPSRLIGWILHQCTADWILRLDDDEVPSLELLRALPDLIRDRRPSALAIKRRWLHSEPGRMIARPAPWNIEYQTRLVRNLPGTWSFDGRVHSDVTVAGELRHVEAPIYHCALLLSPLAARRERAVAYEVLHPGGSYGGLPVNGMYLPELVRGVETEAVPEEDRAAIERVLAPAAVGTPANGPEPAHASRTDVDAFNAIRVMGAGAYRARLEFVSPPSRLDAGTRRHLEMHVTNLGDQAWPPGEAEPLIRPGHRWREAESGRIVADGRSAFTETVAPGARTLILLGVDVPDAPGRYVLEVDVVHEHVRWFGCVVALPLRIELDARSLLVGSPWLPEEAFVDDLAAQDARLAQALDTAAAAERHAADGLTALREGRRWRAANLLARPLDAARRRRTQG
jgi:hypothetical protein